jgi:hypothetical protein
VYTHLINAEKIIDEIYAEFLSNDNQYFSIVPIDFTKDSRMEFIIETDLINLYLNPSDGGTIFELDFKPKSYNILNTLTRWPEAYHDNKDIEKEEVMVDRYKKNMLRLRFFHKETSFTSIETDQYREHGSFIESEFNVVRNEKEKSSAVLELENDGMVRVPSSEEIYPCRIQKIIKIVDSRITMQIRGKFNEIPGREASLNKILDNLAIGVDFPFFFNGEPSKFQWETDQLNLQDNEKNPLVMPLEFAANKIKMHDNSYELKLDFTFQNNSRSETTPIKIFKFPIITYAFTDEGYKNIYQGINLLSHFKPSKEFEFNAILDIA